MDGDGVQELVVLEARGDAGERAISVWRWSGWSFGLVWRSENGRYRDLALTDQPSSINVAIQP